MMWSQGGYFAGQEENPFGDGNGAEIALALFSSPMIIALVRTTFRRFVCILASLL